MTAAPTDWVAGLAQARAGLGRSSTAERVADLLRARLTEGQVAPGFRLSEEAITGALGVSRNTLREAFRLLAHERLLVHELHRGVFVRALARQDVVDVYRLRRLLEVGAARAAVTEGQHAAGRGDWQGVGTANMAFHRALGALLDSPRVDELMTQLLAELRLVFAVMSAPREFHEPYLADNDRICRLVESGDGAGAALVLADYLDRAERQLVEAYDARLP